MNKALRKILILVLIIGSVLSSTTAAFASETILYGYYVKASDLDSNVSKYVSSIYLSNEGNGSWGLYINGSYQGSKAGTVVSFSYAPNANTYYVFTFDTSSGRATSYYKKTTEDTVVSIFSFSIVDAVQTVVFQSDPDASPVARTATKNAQGVYDFGTFSFTYTPSGGTSQAVSFNLLVNANTNKAVIKRGENEYSYNLEGTGKYETVYCENLVPAQELDMDYMATSLEKQTYANAKSILYSASDIDSALANQTITLFNNKTGLSTNVRLQRTIIHWARKPGSGAIGDGTYDEYETSVQVVCQWNEDLCASLRSKYTENGRPFAVYGTSTTYDYVTSQTKKAVVNNYKNISWPDSAWTGAVSFSDAYYGADKAYGIVQYRRAPATWGSYGAWEEYTGAKVRACSNSDDCAYETRTAYAYRARSWGDWTSYAYTSCTEDDETQCRSALKYSKRSRSWGTWSDYIYTGTETLGCSDVATAVGATCDRESATRYARQYGSYSDWSGYSSWSTSACSSSNTTNCESKTWYSYRSMGSWGSWEPTTLNVSCSTKYTSSGGDKGLSLLTTDCMQETQYRYKTRSFSNYTYSGYTDDTSVHGSYQTACTSSTKQSSLCGVSRTYGSNQASKYGSYQSDCMSVYTTDSQCGQTYSSYTYGTSKHGITGQCSSVSTQNSLCGSQNRSCTIYSCATTKTPIYKSCATSACGVKSYSYSSYSTTTEKHGWTESCTSKTGAQSQCGTATCTRYYCATSRTCTKTVLGVCTTYSYSGYKYTYGSKPSPAYDCSSSSGAYSSCGYKSCTTYNCAAGRTPTYNSCQNSACGVSSYSYSNYTDGTSSHGYTEACSSSYKQSSLCGTEYKTCSLYYCPTSSSNKTCYLYSCPTSVTNKSCTIYSCPSTRTANYTAWSGWSDWSTDTCSEGTYKTCDSKVVNYKRTRDWGDWSSYVYSAASSSSTTDHKSHLEYRYQTRSITWGDYSDYIYSTCTASDTLNCKSATRWRTRYLSDWSSWSAYNLDSCSASDTVDCQSQTMYSKKTLGAWGSTLYGESNGLYTYTACTDSATIACQSQSQIRTKKKTLGSYGNWSGNYRSTEDIPYDSNYGYQYRYNNGVYTTSADKGTSTVVGSGSMYVSTSGTSYKDVNAAIVSSKAYTNSERMTTAEISAFTSQLGTDAGEAYYVSSYISSSENTDSAGAKYITWDFWQNNQGVHGQAGQAAVNRFVNEKRFIPYIFITQHYRATNKKFLINGYDGESIVASTLIKSTSEDTQNNVKMYPDQETIYDYCELNPNSDECYCQAHPGASRCQPDVPEPSYCDINPDDDICFCTTYPMSDRCKATSRDTVVIYYNYLDPLENYKGSLPSNWIGYDVLVNEIKRSDLNDKKIQVTLSDSDLVKMRAWINSNEDKIGSCQMIRDFSYIFTDKNEELSYWLSKGSGCSVTR